jgi:hypothetical protein
MLFSPRIINVQRKMDSGIASLRLIIRLVSETEGACAEYLVQEFG